MSKSYEFVLLNMANVTVSWKVMIRTKLVKKKQHSSIDLFILIKENHY
jgi:hypothetical protein